MNRFEGPQVLARLHLADESSAACRRRSSRCSRGNGERAVVRLRPSSLRLITFGLVLGFVDRLVGWLAPGGMGGLLVETRAID